MRGGEALPCPVPFHLAGPSPITLPQAAPDAVSGAGERRVAGGRGWDASFACPALADQARGEVVAALSILRLFAAVLLKTAEAWEKLGSFVQCWRDAALVRFRHKTGEFRKSDRTYYKTKFDENMELLKMNH